MNINFNFIVSIHKKHNGIKDRFKWVAKSAIETLEYHKDCVGKWSAENAWCRYARENGIKHWEFAE